MRAGTPRSGSLRRPSLRGCLRPTRVRTPADGAHLVAGAANADLDGGDDRDAQGRAPSPALVDLDWGALKLRVHRSYVADSSVPRRPGGRYARSRSPRAWSRSSSNTTARRRGTPIAISSSRILTRVVRSTTRGCSSTSRRRSSAPTSGRSDCTICGTRSRHRWPPQGRCHCGPCRSGWDTATQDDPDLRGLHAGPARGRADRPGVRSQPWTVHGPIRAKHSFRGLPASPVNTAKQHMPKGSDRVRIPVAVQ